MPLSHLFLALSVVFIWGTNFVVIKWGLADFPPFLFASLRFVFSAFPWLFFIRKPSVPWWSMAGVGLLMGAGQFGLLFWAMQHDISAGMASLVIQAQVFFTIIMSMLLYHEQARALQLIALALAATGYGVVAWHIATDTQGAVTILGLLTVLMAAFSWACANLLVRSVGRVNMLGFMVWSSTYSVVVLLGLSVMLEGPSIIVHALGHASWSGWLAVLWQALGNTLFGFGVWNWLLARHPVVVVTPTALLVPVFGMVSSAWLLSEALPLWKLAATGLVLGGLALNIYASKRRR
jgi:O-acetylserine/cysteine efflux transporter